MFSSSLLDCYLEGIFDFQGLVSGNGYSWRDQISGNGYLLHKRINAYFVDRNTTAALVGEISPDCKATIRIDIGLIINYLAASVVEPYLVGAELENSLCVVPSIN